MIGVLCSILSTFTLLIALSCDSESCTPDKDVVSLQRQIPQTSQGTSDETRDYTTTTPCCVCCCEPLSLYSWQHPLGKINFIWSCVQFIPEQNYLSQHRSIRNSCPLNQFQERFIFVTVPWIKIEVNQTKSHLFSNTSDIKMPILSTLSRFEYRL